MIHSVRSVAGIAAGNIAQQYRFTGINWNTAKVKKVLDPSQLQKLSQISSQRHLQKPVHMLSLPLNSKLVTVVFQLLTYILHMHVQYL